MASAMAFMWRSESPEQMTKKSVISVRPLRSRILICWAFLERAKEEIALASSSGFGAKLFFFSNSIKL